ncbi:TIGR04222 domain-containing membrane protein [Pseudenhygromyxa sp. WMMC2535]|uniref:TIGR04222 domain-containing membrane protein n=1 Tax=Pseudenhygromyxa sp. WMMC2535 TaxID=2712867 RepID=UPI0015551692|nr:TIGR04222 domain-containing membrane protein [Pseudenhygromyxa sp. WMMC2535]NVB36321.1 TIGR04222 domain-containing membrane protein [Pseudenhygromyxa sp. WMMC2535]
MSSIGLLLVFGPLFAYVINTLALSLQRWRAGVPDRKQLADLDPYELALLRGGEPAVIKTAVAALLRRGALTMTSDRRLALPEVNYRSEAPEPPAVPAEREVLATITAAQGHSWSIDELYERCAGLAKDQGLSRRLSERGLLVDPDERQGLRTLTRAIALLSTVPGLLTLLIALMISPSLFTVGLLGGWLMTSMVLALGQRKAERDNDRTSHGDIALPLIRGMYDKARGIAEREPERLEPASVALLHAVFDDEALHGREAALSRDTNAKDRPYASLRQLYKRAFVHPGWTPELGKRASRIKLRELDGLEQASWYSLLTASATAYIVAQFSLIFSPAMGALALVAVPTLLWQAFLRRDRARVRALFERQLALEAGDQPPASALPADQGEAQALAAASEPANTDVDESADRQPAQHLGADDAPETDEPTPSP